jgi:hypothetical protein
MKMWFENPFFCEKHDFFLHQAGVVGITLSLSLNNKEKYPSLEYNHE